MIWDDEKENQAATPAEPTPKADDAQKVDEPPKVETKPEEQTPPTQAKSDAETLAQPPATNGSTPPPSTDEEMVPQKLIGKVAKAIREKSRADMGALNDEVRALREENARLKANNADLPPIVPDHVLDDDARIEKKVNDAYLKRQDQYGRQKYGNLYVDSLDVIAAQRDAALVQRIHNAPDPAEAVIREAERIVFEQSLGGTKEERQAKRDAEIIAKARAQWEADLAGKVQAKNNQPTDVQSVRAAGSSDAPMQSETWATSLPR